jgi:hypothetical protein
VAAPFGAVFTHPLPSAVGVICHMCGNFPASHKVEEDTSDARHPLTAYLCCNCFGTVMGPVAVRLCARAEQEQEQS